MDQILLSIIICINFLMVLNNGSVCLLCSCNNHGSLFVHANLAPEQSLLVHKNVLLCGCNFHYVFNKVS